MVLHQLLPRYLKAISFAKTTSLFTVAWDEKRKCFLSCSPKWKNVKFFFIHLFYILFFCSGLRFVTQDLKTTDYANVGGTLLFFWGILYGYVLVIFGYTTDSFAAVPNACLSFEASGEEKNRQVKTKWYLFVDLMLRLWPLYSSNCTAMLALLVTIKPALAPFLGYLFQPICAQLDEVFCYAGRMVILLFQMWVWNWFYCMLLYGSVFVLTVPILLIFRYVKDTLKAIRTVDPGSMSGRYRKILVLQNVMNSYFQPYYYTSALTLVCTVNIATAYTLVSLIRRDELGSHRTMGFLFFAYFVLSMAFILGLCGLAGLAHRYSKVLVGQLKQSRSRRSQKSWRKEIKSLPPLKLRYGSNFVDTVTPLSVMGTCVDQIASLLLMN